MKKTLLILTIFLLLFSLNFGQDVVSKDSTNQAAINAANSWLLLVGNEKYDESWEEAAEFFKNAVTKKQWNGALSNLLPPFGTLINREVVSAKYKTSVPGAPDGEYVIITYKSVFSEKSEAIETVTPMKDKDGVWRVSGYFIK